MSENYRGDESLEHLIGVINKRYKDFYRYYINEYPQMGIYSRFVKNKGVNCDYQVDYLCSVYRALGIPISIESGISLGNNVTHFWLSYLDSQGIKRPFDALKLPKDEMKTVPEQIYKIWSRKYGINQNSPSFFCKKKGGNIPLL